MPTAPRFSLLLLAALLLGDSVRAGELQILYPLYSDPNEIWTALTAAASTVPITAIINPDNGPAGPPDAAYMQGISDLQTAGVTVIGYVHTSFGARLLSTVEQDVDTYAQAFTAYGLSGIFVYEASNDPSTLSYYTTLYNYIKSQSGLTLVITNPGTNIPETFVSAPTSDTTVIYEDTSGWPTYMTDLYVANYPAQRFAAIMLNVPTAREMHTYINLAAQRNVGYVYVTNQTTPNPYIALPSYWVDEINFIAAAAVPTTASEGEPVPGQSDGATYASFGTPQTGAFEGTLQAGKTTEAEIFAQDGSVLLEAGQPIPGLSGSVMAKLGQPSGDAALVTLTAGKGGVTTLTDVALVTGLSAGTPAIAAQTGVAASGLPTGITIKSFLAIDGNGTDTFFLATLQGAGVTAKNNVALLAATGSGINLLVRTEAMVSGATVSLITTLAGGSRTLADGRWRAGDAAIGVRLSFVGGSQAIYIIPATATDASDWTLLAQTGASVIAALNGETISSFGLPAFGPSGFAVLANLAVTKGGPVTAANNMALVTAINGDSPTVLVRKGDPVAADAEGNPLTGVTVKTLTDPIVGRNAQVAFILTAAGETAKENAIAQLSLPAIAYSSDGTTWSLLANVGAAAPGGGRWAGFTSLAITDGTQSAPLFTGLLKIGAADSVTSANNVGLWAVDASGALGLLLRTGEDIAISGVRKEIGSFVTLAPASGSTGAASGYDQTGRVEARAKFTDGTAALLKLAVH